MKPRRGSFGACCALLGSSEMDLTIGCCTIIAPPKPYKQTQRSNTAEVCLKRGILCARNYPQDGTRNTFRFSAGLWLSCTSPRRVRGRSGDSKPEALETLGEHRSAFGELGLLGLSDMGAKQTVSCSRFALRYQPNRGDWQGDWQGLLRSVR